jgi:hypothetical protein
MMHMRAECARLGKDALRDLRTRKRSMPTQLVHSLLGVLFLAMWGIIAHIAVCHPPADS